MTAAEVWARVSMRELMDWQRFEEDFGPMTVHERIDAAAQLIAYTIHASAGGDQSPQDFKMRWRKGAGTSPDQFFTWLGAVATRDG